MRSKLRESSSLQGYRDRPYLGTYDKDGNRNGREGKESSDLLLTWGFD